MKDVIFLMVTVASFLLGIGYVFTYWRKKRFDPLTRVGQLSTSGQFATENCGASNPRT
jgi:hypothetical protein